MLGMTRRPVEVEVLLALDTSSVPLGAVEVLMAVKYHVTFVYECRLEEKLL